MAHALVWLLRRYARKDAMFVPLSYYAAAPGPAWDGLVVVSQGLCPNARLALAPRDLADATVVITAAPEHPCLAARSDALVLAHPPHDEASLLVRVQGPAAAMVTAARFVDALMALDDAPSYFDLGALPRRLDAVATAPWDALAGEVAFVTEESTAPVAHALRWKWLEAVASCDPPCWDVLQFAHGPWQFVCERPFTLVTLERDATALFDRLASMLTPARHPARPPARGAAAARVLRRARRDGQRPRGRVAPRRRARLGGLARARHRRRPLRARPLSGDPPLHAKPLTS